MSVVNVPTVAPPVTFAPVAFSPVSPPISYPVAPVSYAPVQPYTYVYYPPTTYEDDSGNGFNYAYVVFGAFVVLALIIAAVCRSTQNSQRIVYTEGEQQHEQQQNSTGVESQGARPSRPGTAPPSPAPPSLQDVHRAASLRAKVVQAIFPETVVDNKSLQYDAEANSFRWTSNKDADTTCSICIERFQEGDTIIPSLCGHIFHRDCIVGWSQIKSDCPVCRQDMWDPKTYEVLEKEIKAGAGQHWS